VPPGHEIEMHYFSCLGGTGAVSIKSTSGYVEHVILQLEGYAGHVMHFGASGARNVNALFFKLMWDPYGFHKKRAETHYAELLFCIRLDLWVTQCIAVRPGHET
jgi:hypothetical protein